MVSPKTYLGLYGWYVARNLRAEANGSSRFPIMLICERSTRCVLRQTTGLSNRLNVSEMNSHSSLAVWPALTISIWPRVSICSCKPWATTQHNNSSTQQSSMQCATSYINSVNNRTWHATERSAQPCMYYDVVITRGQWKYSHNIVSAEYVDTERSKALVEFQRALRTLRCCTINTHRFDDFYILYQVCTARLPLDRKMQNAKWRLVMSLWHLQFIGRHANSGNLVLIPKLRVIRDDILHCTYRSQTVTVLKTGSFMRMAEHLLPFSTEIYTFVCIRIPILSIM